MEHGHVQLPNFPLDVLSRAQLSHELNEECVQDDAHGQCGH